MKLGAVLAVSLAAGCAQPTLHLQRSAVGVVVQSDRGLFAEYRTDGFRGPVLWPLCAPGGRPVTRSFPFADIGSEATDHPHHESVWFTHGDVNGVDCWAGDGSVVAVGAPLLDPARSEIRQGCEWRSASGGVLCRDQRVLRFAEGLDWRTVDVGVELWSDDGELRLGDTKEGTMALRVCGEFCLEGPSARGTIRNSEGDVGKAAWGKRARWVAYSTVFDGLTHTVAMFDAPQNHGHPTTWHARGYGLCAANPFGLHDFLKMPKGSGELVLPEGERLALRYCVWLRTGEWDEAALEQAWQAFADRAD